MNDRKFQRLIRMSKTSFHRLLEIIAEHLPQGLSTNGKSYKPVHRLLAFLYFSGHISDSLHEHYAHGHSEGSMWQHVNYVIEAMNEHFVPLWLTLPTEAQARREAEIFHDHTNFPKIAWAVIDGVHFDVRARSSDCIIDL